MESWGAIDHAEFASKAAAYLNGLDDIAKAGIRPGTTTVWAIFNDGRMLIVPNNRDTSDPADTLLAMREMKALATAPVSTPKRITIPAGRAAMQTLAPGLEGPGAGIPAVRQYQAVNAIGTCHINPLPRIKGLLEDWSYAEKRIGLPTVANLKRVKGSGVFYFNSHGGIGKAPDSTDVYGIWTAEAPTPALEASYRAMLDGYQVVYMHEKSNEANGHCRVLTHYGITAGFVNEHMKFAKDSFVFIDACESMIDPNLRAAFKNAGASVFLGWSAKVDDRVAYKAASFLLDRLLGANAVDPKEDPKQRAFRIDDVLVDMAGRGLDKDPVNGAVLQMERLQGDFGLLSPSILFASLERGTSGMRLLIAGWFGDDLGPSHRRVRLGTDLVDVDTWNSDLIVCNIPNTGSGSAGSLRVEVEDNGTGENNGFPRWSNDRAITRWKGLFKYTHDDPGSLNAVIDMNVVIRADIQSFREKPGATPYETIVLFEDEKSASASAIAGGTFSTTVGECSEVVSYGGTASIGSPWDLVDAGGWSYYGSVDSQKHELLLSIDANALLEGGNYAITGPPGPCTPYSLPLAVMPRLDDCLFDQQDLDRRFLIPMIDGEFYNIDKGSRTCPATTLWYFSFTTEQGTAKIEWPFISSEFWPDRENAR